MIETRQINLCILYRYIQSALYILYKPNRFLGTSHNVRSTPYNN